MNDFVLGPNQTRWLEALESGDYKQEKGHLRKGDGYCCLGVAAELFADESVVINSDDWGTDTKHYTYNGEGACAPTYVQEALKLRNDIGSPSVGTPLTELNDDGTTFEQIASIVRLHPHHYFKEPA